MSDLTLHDARELAEFTRLISVATSSALHNIRAITQHQEESILEVTNRIVANLREIKDSELYGPGWSDDTHEPLPPVCDNCGKRHE
jgi:hypothetical protein